MWDCRAVPSREPLHPPGNEKLELSWSQETVLLCLGILYQFKAQTYLLISHLHTQQNCSIFSLQKVGPCNICIHCLGSTQSPLWLAGRMEAASHCDRWAMVISFLVCFVWNLCWQKEKGKRRFLGNGEVFVVFHKMPGRHEICFTSITRVMCPRRLHTAVWRAMQISPKSAPDWQGRDGNG
jgi:hypothetical protein